MKETSVKLNALKSVQITARDHELFPGDLHKTLVLRAATRC